MNYNEVNYTLCMGVWSGDPDGERDRIYRPTYLLRSTYSLTHLMTDCPICEHAVSQQVCDGVVSKVADYCPDKAH